MAAIERSGATAAAMARRRYLPATEPLGFVIGTSEPVAVGLQRITTHQFTVAIDALADPEAELGASTTTAREALLRIAAILRLVRDAVGRDVCAAELAVIDGGIDFLADLQAGQVEVESLDEIRARYDSALRPLALSDLRDQLLHRHQLMRLELLPVMRRNGSLQHWLHQLRRARARFGAWPVDQPMYGQDPVPDSFAAFTDGLTRTYRKGRRRSEKPGGAPGRWFQSVHDLTHQVELLGAAWPEVIGATVTTGAQLGAALDEHQRIAALQAAVAGDSNLIVDDVTRALVDSICDHERAELVAVAARLGERLYAEKPTHFVARMDRYWSTRADAPVL